MRQHSTISRLARLIRMRSITLKIPKKYSIPFVYPYLADTEENADKLVSSLNKKGKTVYRYWGPLPKSFNEYKFFLRLVPIPILPELS